MLESITKDNSLRYAAPNKDTKILYWFRSPKTKKYPHVNGKIQGLFKAFDCFSSSFQGKFNFQRLFKIVLYIQVLFKPVRTMWTNQTDKTIRCFQNYNLTPLDMYNGLY